jgi:hypothetical protein
MDAMLKKTICALILVTALGYAEEAGERKSPFQSSCVGKSMEAKKGEEKRGEELTSPPSEVATQDFEEKQQPTAEEKSEPQGPAFQSLRVGKSGGRCSHCPQEGTCSQ